jgi:hypothetical protein
MFHLPLHQSYGYRIQNKRTFCATERAVESTVVLPIATCLQTLWHKASAISYQHATSVDQALYEYRHDAPAVVVESKAQVMVSIGYLYTTTSTNSTRNDVLPQATCTLQWQRPDCMFEEEVMRNVCVPVQPKHVVPFQPAVQVSFYPRIVVTTNNNDEQVLLPAILASYQQQQQQQYYHHQNNNTTNATTTMPPCVVLGNVRMTVRVASLNHTTTHCSGNPFDGSMRPTSSVSAAAAAAAAAAVVVPNDHEEEEYTWQAILPLEAYTVTPPPPQGGTASGPVQIPGMSTRHYAQCAAIIMMMMMM